MDYAAGRSTVQSLAGRWDTAVPVTMRGELRHPMPVGVETASGWTIERADPYKDAQTVHVITAERPMRVELDPFHTTWDWDRRNDQPSAQLLWIPDPRITYNWPWLDQNDRDHTIVAFAPAAWYGNPQGVVLGVRAKTNYLSTVDLYDVGLGIRVAHAARTERRAEQLRVAHAVLDSRLESVLAGRQPADHGARRRRSTISTASSRPTYTRTGI